MKLYFSPLACSLASRIALYEAGAECQFVQVDGRTKLTDLGQNFHSINALGLVPTLELESGERLRENAAVLQYIARRYPERGLAPGGEMAAARLQQWLSFIGTELHKAIFAPLLDPEAPEGAKHYALGKVTTRFRFLAEQLKDERFLLGAFSIADGYLFAVLNWCQVTPINLSSWPAIRSYQEGLAARPSVARAFAEEMSLYRKELEAHAR